MPLTVTLKEAENYVVRCVTKQLVPMISGSPGLGKSDLVRQIAKQYNLFVIDMRLSQCDPTDLNGFPTITDERASYKPMDIFPIEGDTPPKGYSGWLLFLDEINSAVRATQAAAYKLVLDRMIGQKKLHGNCITICAGNLATDKAIVADMGTAMKSRLVHLVVRADHNDWIDWANSTKIDPRITAYIGFRPENLHNFDPQHDDLTFPCPRTWEFLSKLVEDETDIKLSDLPLYAGTVGEGAAHEFVSFTKCFAKLPTIQHIVSSPNSAPVPDEPGTLYACSSLVAKNADKTNIIPIIDYVDRMPVEFKVITMKAIGKRDKALIRNSPEFAKWIANNAKLVA